MQHHSNPPQNNMLNYSTHFSVRLPRLDEDFALQINPGMLCEAKDCGYFGWFFVVEVTNKVEAILFHPLEVVVVSRMLCG